MPKSQLSVRSEAILEMIAAGSSYERILTARPDLTYLDIFYAAEEALAIAVLPPEKRERHPRTRERWTDREDDTLRNLVRSGETVARIAGRLGRDRETIRSRILQLNLVSKLTPSEQERLRRLTGLAGGHWGTRNGS